MSPIGAGHKRLGRLKLGLELRIVEAGDHLTQLHRIPLPHGDLGNPPAHLGPQISLVALNPPTQGDRICLGGGEPVPQPDGPAYQQQHQG